MHKDESLFREIARALRIGASIGSAFDARVMRAVRRLPPHRPRSVWGRLNRPRRLTVSPASWGIAAVAALAFAALLGVSVDRTRTSIRAARPAVSRAKQGERPVQFTLVAPQARKVSVVGDFNGWDSADSAYQARDNGGGVWSVTARVPAGHHRYSFVVDDSVWVADPNAPRLQGNDFGLPNSALVVGEDYE